jgi:translation initiation factor IF-2
VTVRSLLGLLLACIAVFGCSFGAARLAGEEEEPVRARSAPPPATRTAQPSLQTLALDAAPALPGLRERPRPRRKPASTAAAAPVSPAAPAPAYTPAPSTGGAPTPAPEPAPAAPQEPAAEPAPSAGETTTFYDGG